MSAVCGRSKEGYYFGGLTHTYKIHQKMEGGSRPSTSCLLPGSDPTGYGGEPQWECLGQPQRQEAECSFEAALIWYAWGAKDDGNVPISSSSSRRSNEKQYKKLPGALDWDLCLLRRPREPPKPQLMFCLCFSYTLQHAFIWSRCIIYFLCIELYYFHPSWSLGSAEHKLNIRET